MPEFAEHAELMDDEDFFIDALISPKSGVCNYLFKLVESSKAFQVLEFSNGPLPYFMSVCLAGLSWFDA